MAIIKVTYGSISRRLTISSTTIWSELETQFRNLFNIPKEIQMIVSYTDEEGDVITLSSDLELQEVISKSSNNTIKFTLTTSNMNDNNNVLDREKSIDTVIDEETSNLINGVSAIHIEDQQQQETPGENSNKSTAESTNNNNAQEKDSSVEGNQEISDDDDEPEIIVIITRNPWLHRRRERLFGECNPYFYSYHNFRGRSRPNYSYHNFGGRFRHGCHFDETQQGYDTSGCNRTASSSGCGRYYRRRQQISPEVVAEKINILHSMGFVNDNLEELVKKHNGNLESVIEFLLFNQRNEQNNEERNKEVVREGNDEKDQPMEVEEENNRPYVL